MLKNEVERMRNKEAENWNANLITKTELGHHFKYDDIQCNINRQNPLTTIATFCDITNLHKKPMEVFC